MLTFQQIILNLQNYWASNGCALLQPCDTEVGAGTSHTATFLRAIGPEPWNVSYIQPSRRPKDSRYGKNSNRIQHYYQYQVILKPAPENIIDLYLNSLISLGLNLQKNDIRFVEDNWKNPTLGAWGVGWEIWLNGMEITQLTYFQQIGGLNCHPILGEITYGIERLAVHLQGVKNVFDLIWVKNIRNNYGKKNTHLTYNDIFYQNELEQSSYNFEYSNTKFLLLTFNNYESETKRLLKLLLILPSYEMLLKATHTFNLLDARGIISVTERTSYIKRIRTLSCKIAKIYYKKRKKLGFPLLNKK